jgi:aconitase B
MNGYYYLNQNQVSSLLSILKNTRNQEEKQLLESLVYQLQNAQVDNTKYRTTAFEKLTKIDSTAVKNEELMVDEDALVSSSKTGAYVQCWVWVESDVKPKRTRKKTVKL